MGQILLWDRPLEHEDLKAGEEIVMTDVYTKQNNYEVFLRVKAKS